MKKEYVQNLSTKNEESKLLFIFKTSANAPAENGLIEIPSLTKIRAQRTFHVSQANLFWQKSGNYLASHTERYASKKIKDDEVKLSVSL